MVYQAKRLVDVRSDIRGPLYQEALRMQEEGQQVLKLNTGNPASFGLGMPPSVRDALLLDPESAVPYCDLRGMNEARAAIVAYHTDKGAQGLTMEDVFIGNGVSEMAYMLLTAFVNPGDQVLMPTPCYTLWSNNARLLDAEPVFYRCDEQAGWTPDLQDIRVKITPRTRALLIINPNNPTGATYLRQAVLDLLEIARQHDLLVISDEIYDRLLLDGATHYSSAALAPDLPVVTLNGLSKSHMVCGFRCGWMVLTGPKERMAPLNASLVQLAALRLCGNALAQTVIPAALNDPESTQALLKPGGRLYEQRQVTCDALTGVEGVSFVKNTAAFYLFPRLDPKRFGITSDKEFCMDLLHDTRVLVIPGTGFEYPDNDHLRIVMLPRVEVLKEAMDKMVDYLNRRASQHK